VDREAPGGLSAALALISAALAPGIGEAAIGCNVCCTAQWPPMLGAIQ
jgi:hypothetical protein